MHFRAIDEGDALVQTREFLEVSGFALEVRLLEERGPQLFHHVAQVEHLLVLHETRSVARHHAHDIDILGHRGLHAGALDLHGHDLARDKARLVHLGQRGASQRRGIDASNTSPCASP